MRIICAPDSFKESMSAAQAAAAMAEGARRARPGARIDLCPIADGGEGTVEAVVRAARGSMQTATVRGPLGGMIVNAAWGRLPDGRTAILELPSAAGLALVPRDRRNPLHATTFGLGQLARAAIDEGCTTIIIGLGGSATCDGGCGMAQALGVRFSLDDDRILDERSGESMTGAHLARIRAIDRTAAAALARGGVRFVAANDVTNPLHGLRGAAHVFAPQKGASPTEVGQLDEALRHLAGLLPEVEAQAPGMGAAGGCAFGIVALLGGTLRRGIELVLEAVGFDERLGGADLVLTGEGRLDEQSLGGKAVSGVVAAASSRGVPVIAVVGSAAPAARAWTSAASPLPLAALYALADDGADLETLMREGPQRLADLAERAVRAWEHG